MNTEHTNQSSQAEPVNQQLLALVKSFGHKTGCAKNAFGEQCTCGVDETIAAAEQAQQPSEDEIQAAFESWLYRTLPSGDAAEVQRKFEESADYLELFEKQQADPVAWVRFCSDGCYEGPIMNSDSRMDSVRRASGAWTPLYTQPPAIAAAEQAQADDAEAEWRRLALQFDGHRMQALAHLRCLLENPEKHAEAVRAFLASPPLSGEQVLTERIAAMCQSTDDWQPSGIEYDRSIHGNPDAGAWAKFFVETFPALKGKEGLMLGWFANAMMAMHDHLQAKPPAQQQAEPVARDVLMAALDDLDNEVVNNHGIGMPFKLRKEIAERYAAQPPAVAVPEGYALVPVEPTAEMLNAADRIEWADSDVVGNYYNMWNAMLAAAPQAAVAVPVARDWPKLLEMARQIIRDGHVHDVGGGDLAVTTCEAFEGLDAFLKKNFPEPLGELTGEERKWLEAEAAIQPPFVPDGYALVPVEPTRAMLCAGQKEWLESAGSDPSFDIYRAMLAAQKGGEA